jgi:hypothetical protein
MKIATVAMLLLSVAVAANTLQSSGACHVAAARSRVVL